MCHNMGVNNPIFEAMQHGPEHLARYFASLPQEAYEATWQSIDAAVAASGYNLEAFKAFARLMMYNPTTVAVTDIIPIHEEWVKTALEHNRVVILAPPESAKTTIMGILFTAFTIGHKPATQNIVVSVSDDQAKKIVLAITSYIEAHPAWKMVFPDIVPSKPWGEDSGFYVQRKGPRGQWLRERGTRKDPTLLGVGYQNRAIIGKRVDGVMVIDDMIDEIIARSDAEMDLARSIFAKVLSSRPTEEGKMIAIGTPWREDDVYATAAASGLYKTFATPAWHEEKDADGVKKLVSYWPENWTIERLEEKRKEVGSIPFELMYLMNLEASKGQVLKIEWLQPPYPHDRIETTWPMFYGVDVAISSKDLQDKSTGRRSYFCLSKWVVGPYGMILVGGVVAKGVGLYQALEIVKSQASIDNPRRTGIEIWGQGELFYQQLLREAPELVLFRVKDTSDKGARFMRMARYFEAGRVRISSAENQFLKEFRDEWVGYTPGGRGATDALDAAFIGLEAAGYQVYSGESKASPADKAAATQKTPWGPSWGIPASKFAPGGGRRIRVP